jgi:hypothetical protein
MRDAGLIRHNAVMNPLRIWALSDGAAGNAKQALALARALDSSEGAVLAAQITLPQPWRMLAPQWLRAPLHVVGGLPNAPLPQIVVGCGRRAAAVLDALKRAHPSLRTVLILDPRVAAHRFDLVLVPQHDRLRGANVLCSLAALNEVDASWLQQARRNFAELGQCPAPRQVFLLGASHKHARWQWSQLKPALEVALARGSVMVSTSRRTPPRLGAQIEQWCQQHRVWCYRGGEPNPYPGLLAWANDITVSPDSVSMLSEACATEAPVYLLPGVTVSGKLARLVKALTDSGRLGALTTAAVALRETTALAAEVRRRLQLD